MKTICALNLAEFILESYPNKGITPMKLQKLAYYAKVWTLVANKNIITADFKKWNFGPVNPDIYYKYKSFGGDVITSQTSVKSDISDSDKELLSFILDNYVDFSAFQLSAMTHNEEPWMSTAKDATISDKIIVNYYSKQSFAKNFNTALFKKGPFHLLKNNDWHSFTLDMEPDEAIAFESFSSYDEFLEHSQEAENESQAFFKELFN